jgi:hypothetical protein
MTNINKKIIISPNDCKILLILNNKISNLRSRLKNKKLSLEHQELIKDAVIQLKNTIYKKFQLMNLLKMHYQIMNNFY